MAELLWTPSVVEAWTAEAVHTLRRLPEQRVQGFVSSWPSIVREYWESFGWDETRVRLGPPSPAAIDRMDRVLEWLRWLDPDDARLVWQRAEGTRWKEICWRFGVGRTTAWERWVAALCVIVARLNGERLPRSASRRRILARTVRRAENNLAAEHFSRGQ